MEGSLRNGVCPKCNGEEVYWANSEPLKILPSNFGLGAWSGRQPTVDNYACGNCGYTEFYVIGDHLEKVKKEWRRVKRR